MKVRKASSKDRKKITELYLGLYPYWKNKFKKKKIPLESKVKKIILLAEDKKEVVGFCWANYIQYGFSRFGYIEELFVSENSRKKGVGAALVKKAVKELKKMKVAAIFVTTGKKNKKAIRLYKSAGFKLTRGQWLFWTAQKRKR